MPWLFGNQISYADPKDFLTQLVTVTYFAEFMRSGQPNPSEAYLMARGYKDALQVYRKSGPWNMVTGDSGKQVKQMDYPAYDSKWIDGMFVSLTLGTHADRVARAAMCVVELLDQLLFDRWDLMMEFDGGRWET